ncbi:mucin-5AC [Patella vulgata]|uniref:mucin-5AC n=1 Tax=Patella vulgata TaxID=6465 RepID=UPI00217F5AF9|nr:mucin-5AC [Patella vulgata]
MTTVPVTATNTSSKQTGTAKLLINADGTVRLMADPKNFPTPGLKDSHKLFAACSDNGQMNVYYSPTGNPSEVYLLKPTANSEGAQFFSGNFNSIPVTQPSTNSHLTNLIIQKQNQLDLGAKRHPNPPIVKLISETWPGKETLANNVSLLEKTVRASDNSNSDTITKLTNALQEPLEKCKDVTNNISDTSDLIPAVVFSKDSAVKLSSSPSGKLNAGKLIELNTIINQQSQVSNSNNSSRTATPDPEDPLANIIDVASTIAAHVADTEKKKLFENSPQTIRISPVQANHQPISKSFHSLSSFSAKPQASFPSMGSDKYENSKSKNSSLIPVVVFPKDYRKNNFTSSYYCKNPSIPPLRPPYTGHSVVPKVWPPSQNPVSQALQSFIVKTNADKTKPIIIQKTAPGNENPRQSSLPQTVQNSPVTAESEEPPCEDIPLSIRIDSVFSLSATENVDHVSNEPTKKRKKKMKKSYKIVLDFKTVKCKPCYVVLERLHHSQENNIKNKLQVQCSEHCRKRTLNYMCGINLLDCKHPDQNRTVTVVKRSKVSLQDPPPPVPIDAVHITSVNNNTEHTSCSAKSSIGQKTQNKENVQVTPNSEINQSTNIIFKAPVNEHFPNVTFSNNVQTLKFNSTATTAVTQSAKIQQSASQPLGIILPTTSNSLLKNYHFTTVPSQSTSHFTKSATSSAHVVNISMNNTIKTAPSSQQNGTSVKTTYPHIVNISSTGINSLKPVPTPQQPKALVKTIKPNVILAPGTVSQNQTSTLTSPSASGNSTKYFLMQVGGKSVLIPAEKPGINSKAFVLNPNKDGTSVLTPANITYSKINSSQNSTTTATFSISGSSFPVSTTTTTTKSAISSIPNSIGQVVVSEKQIALPAPGSPPVSIQPAGKLPLPNLSPNATQTKITNKMTNSPTAPITADDPPARKRKKTLAERYPLPPGVVIKKEPVTRGYGDDEPEISPPKISRSSSLSTAITSSASRTTYTTPNMQSLLQGLATRPPAQTRFITNPILKTIHQPCGIRSIVPSVSSSSPIVIRTVATPHITITTFSSPTIKSVPPPPVRTIAHSTIKPKPADTSTHAASPNALQTHVSRSLQSTIPSLFQKEMTRTAPLLEPSVVFSTEPSTSYQDDSNVVIGEDTDELMDPSSPGPPDLGEPQITLPPNENSDRNTITIDDELTDSCDDVSKVDSPVSTPASTPKTPQEVRIEKLKKLLQQQEKALDEHRRKRATEQPLNLDDL